MHVNASPSLYSTIIDTIGQTFTVEILLLEENGVPEKVFRDRITKKCMQFHVSSPKQTKCNTYVHTRK